MIQGFLGMAMLIVIGLWATDVQGEKRSPETSSADSEALHLTFGVYRTDKASTMYRKFTPAIEAIERSLGKSLKKDVEIELKILRDYDEGLNAIVDGKVDFVRFGPASYVLAKERSPDLTLLAMEQKKGKKRFPGVFVVRDDSPIRKLEQLKGKRFAFGDRNSTIGRFLAQAELLKAGIHAKDLGQFEFLARHDKVASAVLLGDFDAGSLKESTLKKVDKKKKLRVLHRFDNVTKPWIARAKLAPATTKALRDALLKLKDKKVLDVMKVDGWVTATDADYAKIRSAMKRAKDDF